MANDDPFFVVKDEVQNSLNHLQELYEAWKKLDQAKPPTPHNQEQLKWTTDEIRTSIKTIEWDIQDLEDTIKIVESNPQKFKLDSNEISRRRAFVDAAKSKLETTQRALTSSSKKPEQSSAGSSSTNKKPMDSRFLNESSPTNNYRDELINGEAGQQEMIMRQQDQQLDGVYSTVINLKNIAVTMNTELEDQGVLLNNLDNKVDTAQNRLQYASKRLQNFMKQNLNDKTGWCILILSVVVIILLILLVV